MNEVEDILGKRSSSWTVYLIGAAMSILVFVSIAATQFQEIPNQKEENVDISAYYPPPPPPPKPKPKEKTEAVTEIDFSVPIDPSPYEFSMDYLQVSLTPKPDSLETVSFNLDESIDSFRTDGIEPIRAFETNELDKAPVPIKRFSPKLPENFGRRTLKATVQYRITDQGYSENIIILSTNDPEMNELLITTIRRWKFKPAIKDDKPVHSWARHAIKISSETKPDSPFSM